MASPATAVTHRRTDSTHSLEGRKSRFSRHANWNGRILADGSPSLEDGNTLAGDGEGKPATYDHEAGQLPEEDARMAPSRMGCACLETGTLTAEISAAGCCVLGWKGYVKDVPQVTFSQRKALPWLMSAGCGLALALGAASPAKAITYNFENVKFTDFDEPGTTGTISGNFEFTGTTASLLAGQSVFIDYSGTSSGNFTFLPSSTTVLTGSLRNIIFLNNPVGNSNFLSLNLGSDLSSAPGTVSSITGGYYCLSGNLLSNCFDNRIRFGPISGTVRSVPSPVSIVGLAPLMAMTLFRKRFSKLSA
jgi:hypothetical protein